MSVLQKPCSTCNGTGLVGGQTCVTCSGTGLVDAEGLADTAAFGVMLLVDTCIDTLDKCNDILDKCNDILEALSS